MSADVILRIIDDNDRDEIWYCDQLLLLGQLIGWAWLEKHERLPSSLSITKLQPATIKETFAQLAALSDPTCYPEIFCFHCLQGIPQSKVDTLINNLTKALRAELIIYSEIPHTLQQLINRAGIQTPFWTLPDDIVELMTVLISPKQNSSCYCPFNGTLSLAHHLADKQQNVYTELQQGNPLPYLTNLLSDLAIEHRISHPIFDPSWQQPGTLTQFDYCFACPPSKQRYNVKRINDLYGRFPEQPLYGDVIHIRHLLAHCRKQTITVITESVLQRTAGKERNFKKQLLEEGLVKAIIRLPASAFTPYRDNPCLIILDKQQHHNDMMIFDASVDYFRTKTKRKQVYPQHKTVRNIEIIHQQIEAHEITSYSQQVSYNQIIENNYNMQIHRYLKHPTLTRLKPVLQETVPLSELTDLIRGQSVTSSNTVNGDQFLEVMVSDISVEGIVERAGKPIIVTDHLERAIQQRLKPGDILLVIKGQTGKIGLVPTICGNNWIASQSFQIIRLKKGIWIKDPIVLFQYLCSSAGQALLQQRRSGASVPLLQTHDIKKLPIPKMSDEEQVMARKNWEEIRHIHSEIRFLQDKAVTFKQKIWKT
ncbi:MAG: N-6 DNA methylase [Endozoicomonadaceae bacterium]|nr:N-6 DNA methylase [Endozoicomonadaceae bacterium]